MTITILETLPGVVLIVLLWIHRRDREKLAALTWIALLFLCTSTAIPRAIFLKIAATFGTAVMIGLTWKYRRDPEKFDRVISWATAWITILTVPYLLFQ